jgi:hypothetical protein
MATLAELIAERRATLKAFENDIYGQAEHDITTLNDAIERTPIVSQADALAALDLILADDTTGKSPRWQRDRFAEKIFRSASCITSRDGPGS